MLVDEMKTYYIECQWVETVKIPVDANSLEEAMSKVRKRPDLVLDYGGEYLDDSFEVNEDLTVEANKD